MEYRIRNQNGFTSIVLATGFLMVSGILALGIAKYSSHATRTRTVSLDAFEGYYSAEMIAQFALKSSENSIGNDKDYTQYVSSLPKDAEGMLLPSLENISPSFETTYYFTPDVMRLVNGLPLESKFSVDIDLGKSRLMRYNKTNLAYTLPTSDLADPARITTEEKQFCGKMRFNTTRRTVCLTAPRGDSSADIKANGSDGPITISNIVTPVTISWTSSGVKSCTVSPGGYTGTSGSFVTEPLMSSKIFTLSCIDNDDYSLTDRVMINVIGPFVCDGLRTGFPTRTGESGGDKCPLNYVGVGMDDENASHVECCPLPSEDILSPNPSELYVLRREVCLDDEVITGVKGNGDLTRMVYCSKINRAKYKLGALTPSTYWWSGTRGSSGSSGIEIEKSSVPVAVRYALGRRYWPIAWPSTPWSKDQWDNDGCFGYDKTLGQVLLLTEHRGKFCGNIQGKTLLKTDGTGVQIIPSCSSITGNGQVGNWEIDPATKLQGGLCVR